MNTVGADSKRDISMSIDKQFGRRRILAKQVYRFACEEFQLSGFQVFFAQLDVVNSDAGCLGDAAEQCGTLFGIVSSEASAISDVAEQHRESIVADGDIKLFGYCNRTDDGWSTPSQAAEKVRNVPAARAG